MSTSLRVVIPVLAALAAASCVIEPQDTAGKACVSSSDCDPAYRCSPDLNGERRCLVVFPPEDERDAGGTPAPNDAGDIAYWCSEIEPIMNAYCAECHVPGGASNITFFRLDRYDSAGTVLGARAMADRIYERTVRFRDMPPIGAPQFPSLDERGRVAVWVDGGAPFCPDGGSP
jgi:hypothetical protein